MDAPVAYLSRDLHPCRFDWGRDGVRRAANRNDIVVIVDVLRFSTAVVAALQHAAMIYPCASTDDIALLARGAGADIAAYRRKMVATHRYSLSPASYDHVSPGARIVLPSPNGALCSRYGQDAPYLFVGALVNAAAVGAAVTALSRQTHLAVTVIACGERWPTAGEDGELRVALEDYLGAGAILARVPLDKSPKAQVCALSFRAGQEQLRGLLLDSSSGRELRHKGWGADIDRAAQLDCYEVVPVLRGDHFEPFVLAASQ